jgi:serine O-acetyltransferase
MTTTSSQLIQRRVRTIDGLSIRYAESEPRDDRALLLSPWPESIYCYEPTWSRLSDVMDATSSTDRVLWSRILTEAEQVTSREVVLAPLIAAYVTSRANLADAICSRIASLPASPLASAPLLAALRLLLAENASILSAAGADILAVLDRDPATTKALHVLLHAKGFLAVQAHRFANALWNADRRELALHLQGCVSRALQVDIHPAARLGAGIFFDHATGIVIGETSVVEDNVSILQNVTLGGTGKERGERHPKVRRGVLIGAGAIILGNIEIGANARIGAGSVVLEPVAPGSTVAGVPARVLRQHGPVEPSRTRDQLDASPPVHEVAP